MGLLHMFTGVMLAGNSPTRSQEINICQRDTLEDCWWHFIFHLFFWADDGLANCFLARERERLFVFSWLKSHGPGFGLGRMMAALLS